MPEFSEDSLNRLSTCDPVLQFLFSEVVKHWDCKVLEGFRGEEAQHAAYLRGASKVDWPNGKHNTNPSKAVDVAPFPVDWEDTHRIVAFGFFVLGVAAAYGIEIRWGGDWNRDHDEADGWDFVHFELFGQVPEGLLEKLREIRVHTV